jgi:hypothetical protein
MRRPWLVWISSLVAFFLTAVLVMTSGPAQEPPPQQSLPQVEANGSSPLSAVGQNGGSTDFTLALPGNSLLKSAPAYQPRETVYLADPSNYGERFRQDAAGNPVNHDYIVVLHETVGSALSAINLFQSAHPRDEDQVSYHTLIDSDGTVIYIVPPEQRAFGAGDSVFSSANGEESVVTNSAFPGSVNNFAYHVSLETPPDGRNNNATTHSGYSEAQYQSLAWLLSRTNVPDARITTHKAVDQSGTRIDPRSFETERLFSLLHQYPSRSGL